MLLKIAGTKKLIVLLLLILDLIQMAYAQSNVLSVGVVNGEGGVLGSKFSYAPFSYSLLYRADLSFELSMTYWFPDEHNEDASNFALGVVPVFSWKFLDINDEYPVSLIFGIGVSYVDEPDFLGKDLGGHFQFEDRLGFSIELDPEFKSLISVQYLHFSNAGLSKDNPGVDFIAFTYSRSF